MTAQQFSILVPQWIPNKQEFLFHEQQDMGLFYFWLLRSSGVFELRGTAITISSLTAVSCAVCQETSHHDVLLHDPVIPSVRQWPCWNSQCELCGLCSARRLCCQAAKRHTYAICRYSNALK
ncbi:hypothetical protein TRVL_08179 [Trypanosoma vivax]|nr:hypothetical protein TRVL_08179 [Trypanosoma vivax]